jgi:hypothetical protein
VPRKLPPPHPKGAPRTPGSGRRKGTPNNKTVALRELMAAMSGDVQLPGEAPRRFQETPGDVSPALTLWTLPNIVLVSSVYAIDRGRAKPRLR